MDHSQFWMVRVMRTVTESRPSFFFGCWSIEIWDSLANWTTCRLEHVRDLRFEIFCEHVRAAKNDEQIEQLAGCST